MRKLHLHLNQSDSDKNKQTNKQTQVICASKWSDMISIIVMSYWSDGQQ